MSAFLSTIFAILMSFIAIFLPMKPDNVTVTVNPVTTETAIITFECENNTRRTISRPHVTSVEMKDENGNWQNADIVYGYTEEAYSIRHGRSKADSIEIGDPFNESEGLKTGEYRLNVKYIIEGDGSWGYASGEFTVQDN